MGNKCSCGEVYGEDPQCIKHGRDTHWAKANPDFCQIGERIVNAEAVTVSLQGRVERLRRILYRYGDRVPLAMCHRPDWQQEIDEAIEWVANNAESIHAH